MRVRYDWRNGGSHLAVSASGVLIYSAGHAALLGVLPRWVDRDGQFAASRRYATSVQRSQGQPGWPAHRGRDRQLDRVRSLAAGCERRRCHGYRSISLRHRPTWTRTARGITVGAEKGGKWRLLTIPADGTGEPIVLHESPNRLYPNAWTPDGRHLLFQERRPETGWDLHLLQVDTSGRPVGAPQAFAATPFHESNAAISRDGRWLAYESDELDGVVQVYVRSFPDGAHKVRASTGGARWPVWDVKGNLHYWQTGENILHVVHTRESGGQLTVGTPEPVWKRDVAPRCCGASWSTPERALRHRSVAARASWCSRRRPLDSGPG